MVISQFVMETHHFEWKDSLFQWPFSISSHEKWFFSQTVGHYQRVQHYPSVGSINQQTSLGGTTFPGPQKSKLSSLCRDGHRVSAALRSGLYGRERLRQELLGPEDFGHDTLGDFSRNYSDLIGFIVV